MSKSSIPSKEAELLAFAEHGKNRIVAEAAEYGFDAAEIAALVEAVDIYKTRVGDSRTARRKAQTAVVQKDAARKHLRKILGSYVRRMRSKPDLSPAKLVNFGVKPAETTRTPIAAPETAPQFIVSYSSAWHILQIWEEGSARRRRKPNGVVGAEIYYSFDADKNNLDAYKLKEIAFNARHTIKYEWDEIGKQVHYYLKWVTKRGDRSPMSRIETATIAS